VTSSPAGKALLEEIKKSEFNHTKLLQTINNLQPLLFEECYVKSFENIRSKQANEALRHKVSEYDYRGVHLFILVHGF